jgi:hypothetical protein
MGALVVVGIASFGGWAYLEARRDIEQIQQDLGSWVGTADDESGTQLHIHDTYYTLANPGWTIVAGGVFVVGLAALFAPKLFLALYPKKRDTEQAAP